MWGSAGIKVAFGLAVLIGAVGGGVGAGAVAAQESITPLSVGSVEEVSDDGRYLLEAANASGDMSGWIVLDRSTGRSELVGSCPLDEYCPVRQYGFVVDNPALRLTVQDNTRLGWYPDAGVVLTNSTTGKSVRVDTDSSGAPLVPAWTGTNCDSADEHCYFDRDPSLRITTHSFSSDGSVAAFCANYADPHTPLLYIKDLVGGALTRTTVTCGIQDFLDVDNPHSIYFFAPDVSSDGRVVHVPGDWFMVEGVTTGWHADRLYTPATGATTVLPGRGTMTRDGSVVFLARGVHEPSTTHDPDPAPGPQCAYAVATGKCPKLAWWKRFFGERGTLSLHAMSMSRRGKYLTNGSMVINRVTGDYVDVSSILRERGMSPGVAAISGDATTVIAATGSNDPGYVAVTGWNQPMAVAFVTARARDTQLGVDIQPDGAARRWVFQLQRLEPNGTWTTLPTRYKATGRAQTRIVRPSTEGAYRVRVLPKGKYRGSLSAFVVISTGR